MSLTLAPVAPDDFPAWLAMLRDRLTGLIAVSAVGRVPEEAAEALERALPTQPDTGLLWVQRGDQRVGHAWVADSAGVTTVRDIRLDDLQDADELRALLVTRAQAADSTALEAHWTADDPSHAAFINDARFEAASTNMALPLTELPMAPDVTLRPMTVNEYADWWAVDHEEYIATRVRNGESPEVARRTADEQSAQMLPDGQHTHGHSFSVAEVAGDRVGILWLDLRAAYAFVFQVEVEASARGRGYGRVIMNAAAHTAHRAGKQGIALNVFGDNVIARRLYDSLGYQPIQGGVRMVL
ncbi:GNAT family N-acetyltransferase [Demetria terragena]|uniref:GNAT family N-acetyltransferase n=1 Tax=Demetria terragena TaxID=63959 RepID=UPI000382953D|nr:GNAT family N-acetyltransferase [Demetria terragena]